MASPSSIEQRDNKLWLTRPMECFSTLIFRLAAKLKVSSLTKIWAILNLKLIRLQEVFLILIQVSMKDTMSLVSTSTSFAGFLKIKPAFFIEILTTSTSTMSKEHLPEILKDKEPSETLLIIFTIQTSSCVKKWRNFIRTLRHIIATISEIQDLIKLLKSSKDSK